MKATSTRTSALGMTLEDWDEWVRSQGEPAFRARQIASWIFVKRAASFEEMSDLGQDLRERLAAAFRLEPPPVVRATGSHDTTRKFLFRLDDGRFIETVRIPASVGMDGSRSGRMTLCVSSQVGCAYDCKFCASGLAGFTRNLTAAEIVGQVLGAERETGEPVRNLVFMGMGEPLANLNQLTRAITILNSPWGLKMGARHITVSTSGLAPQIEKLARVPLQIRLAVSLHGASDEVRDRIMPINRKYPIARLFQSLEVWREIKKQRITFEYILIAGVNDGLDQAALLAKRVRALDAKVNLIPYNTVEGLEWERPSARRQEAFAAELRRRGVFTTLRREKGHDIEAACGQLRLVEEKAAGLSG